MSPDTQRRAADLRKELYRACEVSRSGEEVDGSQPPGDGKDAAEDATAAVFDAELVESFEAGNTGIFFRDDSPAAGFYAKHRAESLVFSSSEALRVKKEEEKADGRKDWTLWPKPAAKDGTKSVTIIRHFNKLAALPRIPNLKLRPSWEGQKQLLDKVASRLSQDDRTLVEHTTGDVMELEYEMARPAMFLFQELRAAEETVRKQMPESIYLEDQVTVPLSFLSGLANQLHRAADTAGAAVVMHMELGKMAFRRCLTTVAKGLSVDTPPVLSQPGAIPVFSSEVLELVRTSQEAAVGLGLQDKARSPHTSAGRPSPHRGSPNTAGGKASTQRPFRPSSGRKPRTFPAGAGRHGRGPTREAGQPGTQDNGRSKKQSKGGRNSGSGKGSGRTNGDGRGAPKPHNGQGAARRGRH